MRVKLTPSFVKNAKAEPSRERSVYWDTAMQGFGLAVTSTGHRSWVVQYRTVGTSRRYTIKGSLSLAKARKQARRLQGLVADGRDPVTEQRKKKAETSNTFEAVAREYLARDGKKLRSYRERERIFSKYVFPRLGSKQIDEVRRLDIVRMLDKIEDESGPVQADAVLAVVRKLFNWHAARSGEFKAPLVKAMGRAAPAKERARKRILKDPELQAFWRAAEAFPGAFGFLVRFILLSATRVREASNMTRREVSGDDLWVIPAERHKSKQEFELPLSKAASALLATVPQIAGQPGWIFSHDGKRPIGGFSKFKRKLDQKMLEELRKDDSKAELEPWVLHDLRRTARSLMSRARSSAPTCRNGAWPHGCWR